MKIGILTYHRSHNYGALLQAIASRTILTQLGNDVYFIDYWPSYHKRYYQFFNPSRIEFKHPIKTLRYLKNIFLYRKWIKKRISNTHLFIQKYIDPYCGSYKDTYDVIYYGSDQIWRKQLENVGYNPIYFGKNSIIAKKHIAYAASMGVLPDSYEDKMLIKDLVRNINVISVRENNLKELLINLGFKNVSLCLDPTLLLTASQWNSIFKNSNSPYKEKYAVYYEVMINSFDRQQMEIFASSHGLKLIRVKANAMHKETESEICTCDAEYFVNLIRNSEFVFTSSFHGLAFALNYHKPFYASFSRNSGRAQSILALLNLTDKLLSPMSMIPINYSFFDYSKVDSIMQEMRNDSMNFIRNYFCD